MSYIELLPRLIPSQLLVYISLTPIEPPYPCWYDANANCDYHYGIKGHSTKNCLALKNNVQALKNASYVSFGFDKADGPNVTSNPLPNHSGPRINAVLENLTGGRKTCIRDVITPMGVIHKKLIQDRSLQSKKKEAIEKGSLNKG